MHVVERAFARSDCYQVQVHMRKEKMILMIGISLGMLRVKSRAHWIMVVQVVRQSETDGESEGETFETLDRRH